jgi:hypothetical protein
MSTTGFGPVSESIETEWSVYLELLEAALRAHGQRFGRTYRLGLSSWHSLLFKELRAEPVRRAFVSSWQRTFGDAAGREREEQLRRIEHLLREELRGISAMLGDLVDVLPENRSTRRPGPGRRRWWALPKFLRRAIGLKEGIKAGGTLLGSLHDLLEAAPGWLKAVLAIAKEAADVAAG